MKIALHRTDEHEYDELTERRRVPFESHEGE